MLRPKTSGKKTKVIIPKKEISELKPLINRGQVKIIEAYFEKIDINKISPNPNQPRRVFDEKSIAELGRSIRQEGLLQPIVIKRIKTAVGKYSDKYVIVAGERRYRAFLNEYKNKTNINIECKILADDDNNIEEKALIENLQRENLSPIEISTYIVKLKKEKKLTEKQIAARLGKSVSSIKDYARLQFLPKEIIKEIQIDPKKYTKTKLLEMTKDLNPNKRLDLRKKPKIVQKKTSVKKKSSATNGKTPIKGKDDPQYIVNVAIPVYEKMSKKELNKLVKALFNGNREEDIIGKKTLLNIKATEEYTGAKISI